MIPAAVTFQVGPAQIVGDDQHDVEALFLGEALRRQGQAEENDRQ